MWGASIFKDSFSRESIEEDFLDDVDDIDAGLNDVKSVSLLMVMISL